MLEDKTSKSKIMYYFDNITFSCPITKVQLKFINDICEIGKTIKDRKTLIEYFNKTITLID